MRGDFTVQRKEYLELIKWFDEEGIEVLLNLRLDCLREPLYQLIYY